MKLEDLLRRLNCTIRTLSYLSEHQIEGLIQILKDDEDLVCELSHKYLEQEYVNVRLKIMKPFSINMANVIDHISAHSAHGDNFLTVEYRVFDKYPWLVQIYDKQLSYVKSTSENDSTLRGSFVIGEDLEEVTFTINEVRGQDVSKQLILESSQGVTYYCNVDELKDDYGWLESKLTNSVPEE